MSDFFSAEKRASLEKRLREAFPVEWQRLSHAQKKHALDRFYRDAWEHRPSTKEFLAVVVERNLNYGIVVLGILLAFLAGLTVNIAHEYLNHLGLIYHFAAPVLTVLALFALIRLFEQRTNLDYREAFFLDALLSDFESRENK